MKRWLKIAGFVVVLGLLTLKPAEPRMFGLFAAALAGQECPPPVVVDPNDIGFEYDVGRVLWPIVKAERTPLGEEWSCGLRCCDPEEMPLSVQVDAGPAAMTVTPDANDAEVFRLEWTPMELGVHYIEVSCTDTEPPDTDGPKTTRRCIVLDVYRINQPPVITGCGG